MEYKDITVPAGTAEKLIGLRDPRACLLWLRLNAGAEGSEKTVAAELGWSLAEYRAAAAQLESIGLIKQKPIEPAEELPNYSAADIGLVLERDPEFSETLRYAQTRLGRTLSTADTSRLLGIYQNVGLPAGALMLLISYCDSRAKRRSGETARVTMLAIEKEAYRWANYGVSTEREAEEYVRRLEEREERSAVLARRLQITGRALTPTERSYIERWSELPLDDDIIYAAYDLTVVNTGSLKWRYMDRILENWMSSGVPDEFAHRQTNPPANSIANPAGSAGTHNANGANVKNVASGTKGMGGANRQGRGSAARQTAPRPADSERLRRLREIEEKKNGRGQ